MNIEPEIQLNIKKLLAENPIILFMKGNRSFPACGFSARAITILEKLNITYHTVDILEQGELRESLKEYSSWPTYPQLYIKEELLGGSDIILNLFESGELKKKIDAIQMS